LTDKFTYLQQRRTQAWSATRWKSA